MTALLVLRPEPGASATAARIEALGLRAVVAPLFTIASVDWEPSPPRQYDALMLTSANAVRHAGAALSMYSDLPVFAVGRETAAAAREIGLRVAHVGAGDAADLLAAMAAAGLRAPLHLVGAEHRAVNHAAVNVTRRIVYRSDPVSALPAGAESAVRSGCVALLHSPRASAHFAVLLEEAGLSRADVVLAAISPAAAEAAGEGWRRVGTAPAPHDAALLAVAARLCEEADAAAGERT